MRPQIITKLYCVTQNINMIILSIIHQPTCRRCTTTLIIWRSFSWQIFQSGYTIPVITTQVDGYGDTIDISSLPDGNYTIVITSEFNNEFEGQFIVN